MEKFDAVQWRKSTRCGTNACIEVAKVADEYLIRDSKDAQAEPLRFTAAEWEAFVEGVAAGEFRF